MIFMCQIDGVLEQRIFALQRVARSTIESPVIPVIYQIARFVDDMGRCVRAQQIGPLFNTDFCAKALWRVAHVDGCSHATVDADHPTPHNIFSADITAYTATNMLDILLLLRTTNQNSAITHKCLALVRFSYSAIE